jgi:hypothetical protein
LIRTVIENQLYTPTDCYAPSSFIYASSVNKIYNEDLFQPYLQGLYQMLGSCMWRGTKEDNYHYEHVLKDFLEEGDWWELKSSKRVVYIVLHEAVKKIANKAGISTNIKYDILTQPSTTNNYTICMQATITDSKGRITTDLGESSRDNLGIRGRSNPMNMAQKRAYDRAVFNHLGITGILGEDELPDTEEPKEMDKLTFDEQKSIVPMLNELFAATTKPLMSAFNKKMQKEKGGFSVGQLELLRGVYKKQLAQLTKSF